jgi:hypothetical protein
MFAGLEEEANQWLDKAYKAKLGHSRERRHIEISFLFFKLVKTDPQLMLVTVGVPQLLRKVETDKQKMLLRHCLPTMPPLPQITLVWPSF